MVDATTFISTSACPLPTYVSGPLSVDRNSQLASSLSFIVSAEPFARFTACLSVVFTL